MDWLISSTLVAGIGDVVLQRLTADGVINVGLDEYFEQHGPVESVILAAGLTSMWTVPYMQLVGNVGLFIPFAGLVDELYRQYHHILYPSLAGYYSTNSRPQTIGWNMMVAGMIIAAKKILY